MKISYSEYIKKSDVTVLLSEAIFTELEKKYPLVKINDVASTTSGGTPLRSNSEFYDGDIPWLKSGELNDGIIQKSDEFISLKGLENSSAKLHPEGTLLVAMYGATAGKTGITKIKASTNQAVCAIYPKENIERDYLFWFFRSHRFKFIQKSKGGAQPNISQKVILDTKVPLPPKEKQKIIIQVLKRIQDENKFDLNIIPEEFKQIVSKVFYSKNSVTDISSELTNQLNLVKQLRQAFLREAMQGQLTAKWRDNNPNVEPANELLKKIKTEKEKLVKEGKLKKDKPLPAIKDNEIPFEIPKNWEWCRLDEVCQIKGGKRVPNGYQLLKTPTPYIYIRVSDMKNGTISDEDLHYIDEIVFQQIKNYTISKEDIYMTIVGGTIGKCGLVPLKFHNMNLTENAAKIIPLLVDRIFLWNCLSSPFCQSQFIDKTKQVGVQKMALNRFSISLIPLPPISEQQQIVAKLDELMKYCDDLEKSIKTSQQQNEMLLQQVLREALEKENEI